jgi:hypothetical protein
MNSILRYFVTPGPIESGMGNRSYFVMAEWVHPRGGGTTLCGDETQEFYSRDEAKTYARKKASEWPYPTETCFLTLAGKYLPI